MLKKLIISFLVISLIFNIMIIDNYTFAEFKDEVKAPINLIRILEKNQYQTGEEFIINYTIQPQNLSIDDVYPEYYLMDKEVVLVMDVSGSMRDKIIFNQNKETIEIRKYIKKLKEGILEIIKTVAVIREDQKDIENILEDLEDNLQSIKKYISKIKVNNEKINKEFEKIEIYIKNIRNNLKEIETKQKGRKKRNKKVSKNIIKNAIEMNKRIENLEKLLKVNKTTRIEAMKFVSKRFLEKLKDDDRIKVSLIPYDTRAWDSSYEGKEFADLSNNKHYNELIKDIDSLQPYGGTNIGDGLRKAYYKLKGSTNKNSRKYIILMTDGEPTAYSFKDYMYYFGEGNNYYTWGGSIADYWDLKYAKLVGEKLLKNGGLEIKSFMIGFSDDANLEKLKQIADSSGGYFKKAEDGDTLDDVYQALADEISSDLPIHNAFFKETIPDGFEILEVSEGLKIKGNTVTGDIGSIIYRLDKERKEFIAEPINFWIKVKANKVGKYQFGNTEGQNESYVSYIDIDGKERVKYFPVIDISVYETEPPVLDAELSFDTDSSNKKLNITVNEPSLIEVLYNDEVIKTIDCREELFGIDEIKEFNITLKRDIQNSLVITATDLSGNKVMETVPYLSLDSINLEEYEHNDLKRPVQLELSTEPNSTIEEIIVNGIKSQENKVTDEGFYTANVVLLDGSNEILVKVKNQYNNIVYRTFKIDIDAKSPLIDSELKDFKLTTNFDEQVEKVWFEADLNNDEIISEDEIFDDSNISISYNEDYTKAEITLTNKFSNRKIKIKAKDLNGNIGFLNIDVPKLNRILGHGILINGVQLKKYEDNSINIVNGYKVKFGIIFSIDSEADTLTLHLNKDRINNVKLLGEFKYDLYEISEGSIVRKVAIKQQDINIQSNDNEIIANINLHTYSDIFERKLLLVYTFRPLVENLGTQGLRISNRFSINESVKDIDINIKPLPKIE
ncbi:hypothetical protein TR13x_01665 [Caloranaerobacter sp. TR13]|uniref:vWA domain-containing protein n=1 Tax=Caloranaerobacter sp. TR13 TaxID=1302151 RepID=UPI0006D458FA|nr:vWA domain-containing protein [Caloranaerobacter sp. TR13]KPU28073.1 hypothetical protein TR13x_01665 [Caloranaerobacter sp. TR13]